MPKVSLIIPVYNVENYLKECLDSVEKQTYKDFECILVDDGSTDNSGKMCDEYAATHENTRVIHKENGGLSDARNVGVKESCGDYISFVDSDDCITYDHLEYLVMLTEKYDADVSIAEMKQFVNVIPTLTQKDIQEKILTTEVALRDICYGKCGIFAWGKLYKRELVEKYPYPKGKLYEDLGTTYKILGDSSVIVYGDKEIYFWRQRPGSITKSKITEEHLCGIEFGKAVIKYMEERFPFAVEAAQVRCINKINDLAYRLVMGNKDKELFEKIRAEVNPLLKPVLKNRNASISVKLRATALRMGYIPFLLISKIYALVKKGV